MRTYNGNITKVQFSPMVVILSWIDITVNIPVLNTTIQIREEGTIQDLSNKFEFIIVNEHHWDLRPVENRLCQIVENNEVYKFLKYI